MANTKFVLVGAFWDFEGLREDIVRLRIIGIAVANRGGGRAVVQLLGDPRWGGEGAGHEEWRRGANVTIRDRHVYLRCRIHLCR